MKNLYKYYVYVYVMCKHYKIKNIYCVEFVEYYISNLSSEKFAIFQGKKELKIGSKRYSGTREKKEKRVKSAVYHSFSQGSVGCKIKLQPGDSSMARNDRSYFVWWLLSREKPANAACTYYALAIGGSR